MVWTWYSEFEVIGACKVAEGSIVPIVSKKPWGSDKMATKEARGNIVPTILRKPNASIIKEARGSIVPSMVMKPNGSSNMDIKEALENLEYLR